MANKIASKSKMTKFQRTLNGIEKGLYKRFKRNTLQMRGEIRWDSLLHDIQDGYQAALIISRGFSFIESPEGLDYWADVYSRLEDL